MDHPMSEEEMTELCGQGSEKDNSRKMTITPVTVYDSFSVYIS